MRATKQLAENKWRNIGRDAARKGYALSSVLTGDASINALIKQGYEQQQKKQQEGNY